MKELTRTENLRNKIGETINGWGNIPAYRRQRIAKEALKACKEAGLKFVFRNWDGKHTNNLDIEEIEI